MSKNIIIVLKMKVLENGIYQKNVMTGLVLKAQCVGIFQMSLRKSANAPKWHCF
jgi:hypothetical protein